MSWKDKYLKAVTFSYDDGVTQDIRMINLRVVDKRFLQRKMVRVRCVILVRIL